MLAVIFVIVWALVDNLPHWVIASFFVWALILAGYQNWRIDHIRLMPNMTVTKVNIFSQAYANDPSRIHTFVQILPECTTELPINNCSGHLLRVCKRASPEAEWETTQLNQPRALLWSWYDKEEMSVRQGIEQYLNVCCIDSVLGTIRPWTNVSPASLKLDCIDMFRFDIRITADDCPPVDVVVAVKMEDDLNKPTVKLFPKG